MKMNITALLLCIFTFSNTHATPSKYGFSSKENAEKKRKNEDFLHVINPKRAKYKRRVHSLKTATDIFKNIPTEEYKGNKFVYPEALERSFSIVSSSAIKLSSKGKILKSAIQLFLEPTFQNTGSYYPTEDEDFCQIDLINDGIKENRYPELTTNLGLRSTKNPGNIEVLCSVRHSHTGRTEEIYSLKYGDESEKATKGEENFEVLKARRNTIRESVRNINDRKSKQSKLMAPFRLHKNLRDLFSSARPAVTIKVSNTPAPDESSLITCVNSALHAD